MATKEIPFRPRLEGNFRTRFYNAVSCISKGTGQKEIEEICAREINWVENECIVNFEQRKKYRAVWYLFRDLVRASWCAEFKDGILVLRLSEVNGIHSNESKKEAKDLIRSWMKESRHERLVAASDFVNRMETPTTTKKSVAELIANGKELQGRLLSAKNGDLPVYEAVQPYLQLVCDGDVDQFTGQKISDIWRYFRMTWATPAETTPGRTMQYLVRDAAHPMHAVMGLASLENSAVAISCRDDFIGWTQTSFISDIKKGVISPLDAYNHLISCLTDGISGIKRDDLCSDEDAENPSDEIIARLLAVSEDADRKRNALIASGVSVNPVDDPLGGRDKAHSDESVALLFLHKRAEQLAKYLTALRRLKQAIARENFENNWEVISQEEAIGAAIRSALTAQKSKHIGTSMLELNVCGAIPPYNEILGGKLVALLATSPQVIHDYRVRYGGRRSEIASQLKGEDICRPADLVFVGTTSLYSVGSSQYNRLRMPKDQISGKMDIEWKKIGFTTGFGTLHISRATTLCLKEAMGENGKVNHVFGEGPSPKMRLLAAAIRELLESSHDDTKDFSKHAMSRIVYGVKLACNTSQYLLGIDSEPEYYTDTEDYESGTTRIIRFWQDRWLAHRLDYEPAFDRLNEFSTDSILVGNEIKEDETWHFEKLIDQTASDSPIEGEDNIQFIRDFYRGSSSFADEIDMSRLKSVHIEMQLDRAICDAVGRGCDVVLTGNPGDGKTHLIRILSEKISQTRDNILVELDASTKSNEELYELWRSAKENGKIFVVAINAAVLHALYETHKDFQPISDAHLQMIHAVIYGESPQFTGNVVVFDLSKREVLTQDVINAVISNLTNNKHYSGCASCIVKKDCPVAKNRILINTDCFKERLSIVAQRAILTGYHATLRELQAFVSYLIFGDRDCATIAKTTGNNKFDVCNLVYSGKGKIFDAFRAAFDPVHMSHPQWDERLLVNDIDPSTWDSHLDAPVEAIDPNNLEEFFLRKRQFFFFNQHGKDLVDFLDDDVAKYQLYLRKTDKEIANDTIRKLNTFFGKPDVSSALTIWSGHRFNTSPRKILISSGSIKNKKFEIGHPHLLESMGEGIDYVPSFIKISPKANPSTSLKIDFPMFSFLTAAERGVPVLFIDTAMTKRVWHFVEQLQDLVDAEEDSAVISIMDVPNKMEYQVSVDLEDKKYTEITKSSLKDKK